MDAEDLGALADAVGEEGEGAGIAVAGIGLVEHVTDDGFAADGEEKGALEAMEVLQVGQDGEVVVLLLREIDAGIKDQVFHDEARLKGSANAGAEKVVERSHDVIVTLISVLFLGQAN